MVQRTSKRILRFLQRRGVISLVAGPGDGEVIVVGDESMGEKDPLLGQQGRTSFRMRFSEGKTALQMPMLKNLDFSTSKPRKISVCHALSLRRI